MLLYALNILYTGNIGLCTKSSILDSSTGLLSSLPQIVSRLINTRVLFNITNNKEEISMKIASQSNKFPDI